MKSPALNKLLEKSPVESLSALATGAFMRADTDELRRIVGAMTSHPRASRREFMIRHHAMTESVLLWVVEYWKTVATVRTCLVAALAAKGEESAAATFLADANKAKQASLIEAMRQICADNGIDFEDVATFAEIDTELDAKPIPKLIPEYVELFGIAG